jgi:hypothetical protein
MQGGQVHEGETFNTSGLDYASNSGAFGNRIDIKQVHVLNNQVWFRQGEALPSAAPRGNILGAILVARALGTPWLPHSCGTQTKLLDYYASW